MYSVEILHDTWLTFTAFERSLFRVSLTFSFAAHQPAKDACCHLARRLKYKVQCYFSTMSAVKERIREFEERSTPKRDDVTPSIARTPSSRRLIVESPKNANRRSIASLPFNRQPESPFVTPKSSRKMLPRSKSARRLDLEGNPFLSPPLPQSNRTKSISKLPVGSPMDDVTNRSSTLQPRKLELVKEGDSVAKSVRSGDTITSSVKKRKEELELRNKVTRLEKKLQDVRLGRSTTTTITTVCVNTVQTCEKRDSCELNLELIMTPTNEEATTTFKQTNRLLNSRRLKRFWEILYAILAILELLTCQGLYDFGMNNASPKALVPRATIASSAKYQTPKYEEEMTTIRTKPFGVPDSRRYWGQHVHTVIHSRLESLDWARQVYTTFRSMTWQECINKAFMIAILIHTIIQSWAIAASRNNEKRQREQYEALASAAKVTRRSKRRFKNLETSSTNRHFIMRWTSNRIKWSKRTTEILGASCIILLLRLLFLPILKRNKVVTIQSTSRDGISLPFISPIYTPKETLEMTIEIAGHTLSLVEISHDGYAVLDSFCCCFPLSTQGQRVCYTLCDTCIDKTMGGFCTNTEYLYSDSVDKVRGSFNWNVQQVARTGGRLQKEAKSQKTVRASELSLVRPSSRRFV